MVPLRFDTVKPTTYCGSFLVRMSVSAELPFVIAWAADVVTMADAYRAVSRAAVDSPNWVLNNKPSWMIENRMSRSGVNTRANSTRA